MLSVGRILKSHGIKGEVKVESFMDSPNCFVKIKKFFISDTPYFVERITKLGGFLLVKFKNVDDRNLADKLQNQILYCEKKDLPNPQNKRFYIADIIGCKVVAENKDFGTIVDILQNGSADIVVIEKNKKQFMFPWIKELNAKIDIDNKIFEANAQKLGEVIVDED